MPRILIPLPARDFDPTEVAVPFAALGEAGHEVIFATPDGQPATCDPVTLTGDGLPGWAKSLAARPDARRRYDAMIASEEFQSPISWEVAAGLCSDGHAFDGMLLPGGHAPGMKPYLESSIVQQIAANAFARNLPVASICHGGIPLARARKADGKPLLAGRHATGLTAFMENFAIALTKGKLGDHYRTYPQTVEAEMRGAIGSEGRFETGPLIPRYATAENRSAGFIVADGNYLSARWPGDAWTLAQAFCQLLATPAIRAAKGTD